MANDPVPSGRGVRTPPHPGETQGESFLTRRQFIRRTVQLAVLGAILPGAASQILPALAPSALSGAAEGPVIRRGPKNEKIPITVDELGDAPLVGEWGFLPAIIYKVKVAKLEGSAKARKYNTGQFAVPHPSDAAYAIMVYQGKCKHLGCTVGWNSGLGGSKDIEDYDGDGVPDGRILCPCHQGQYDIYDNALNQPGTPPPAPLNIIRFNVKASYSDPDGKIPNASNVLYGTELLEQGKYRDADKKFGDSKDGKSDFKLASQASKVA